MSMIAAMIGRLLLGAFFVISGIAKIADPASTAGYIESSTTLPGTLALPTGIFEVVAGVLLAVGLMTRLVSILLFGFTLLTIFFFHNEFSDQAQATQALKNMAIAGGLLMVFAYGQVKGTFDYMRERRRTYDAELKLARAEGRAEGATAVPHGGTTVVHDAPRTVVADRRDAVVTDVDRDGVPEVRPKRRWF